MVRLLKTRALHGRRRDETRILDGVYRGARGMNGNLPLHSLVEHAAQSIYAIYLSLFDWPAFSLALIALLCFV